MVGLATGTILGHVAAAARQGVELLPLDTEHAIGLGIGVLVSLWIAADI